MLGTRPVYDGCQGGRGRRPERPLGQDVSQDAAETGDHVLAVESITRAQLPNVGERAVDRSPPPSRVDHPDQANTRLEILADLVKDVPRSILRRKDLDRQVRRPRG